MKFDKIYNDYSKTFPIPSEEWEKLEQYVQVKSLAKGELIAKPGDHSSKIAMVIKGLFRLYYIGDEGREYIKAFRGEGEMAAPYAEILQQIPVRTFVEALEDSEVLLLDYRDLETLAKDHPCWNQLRLKIAQDLYIQKEQKEFDLLQLSAPERYKNFLATHGKIIKRIPQYHIAAYLGITAVALSRIIKKIND